VVLCAVAAGWALSSQTDPPAASVDPEILERPFTADQIRDEMVVGSEITVRTRTRGREEFSRWRVVAADDEGVDIEYTPVDADGNQVGDSAVQHSGWIELRDHASFPADRSTRKRAVMETALGELDGWLYTITDEEVAAVSEFFFATEYPGAPVYMRALRKHKVTMEMEQLSRTRPPK
jgi:hypothetical protein